MNHAQQEPAIARAGRTSRRRALGALAAGGFGAGLAATLARTGVAWDGEGTPAVAAVGSDATSPFNFRLAASTPETFAGGTVRSAGSQQIAAAAGVSIKLVDLEPGGMRELHWHPNAAEINYCLEGEGIVGILSATGETATFAIGPGSIGFMPKGDAHYIRNTGQDTMRLVLGFSDEAAENLDFSACLPWVPSDLINQTLGVPAGTLPMLPVRGDLLLVQVEGAPAEIPSADPTPFSTTLDHLTTQAVAGGAIHPLRVDALPRLDSITVFDLVIDGGAVREPHWHGNASEFNYCVRGAAQLGLVAPSGESWTFTVEAGDVAFVPENWFHYIANVNDDEPAEFLAFFTNTVPSHVELSTMADYFPPEVMAASFGIDPGVFAALPKRGTVVIAPPLGADGGEATPEPATPAS